MKSALNMTDYIAMYAAALSTLVFLWSVSNSRSKIAVTLISGIFGSGEDLQAGVYLGIKNPSPHTVHVTFASLLYPYRRTTLLEKLKHVWEFKRFHRYINWVHNSMVFDGIDTGLPISIEPQNSHTIFIPEEKIWEMLEKEGGGTFAAVVQDALWRNKYSSAFEMYPRPRAD